MLAINSRSKFDTISSNDPPVGRGVSPGVGGNAAQRLVPALRRVLPRVQWILTTSSTTVAASCETGELLALRRTPPSQRIELYEGAQAVVH